MRNQASAALASAMADPIKLSRRNVPTNDS